jgi:phosphoglycolate phosphatase
MTYQAVMFDLDGTLLNTIEDLTDSMNHALGLQGFEPRTVEECLIFVGDGVEAFARRALPADRQDQATADRCIRDVRAAYAARWTVKTRPYDGIADLLAGLRERGLVLTLLTNKPDEFTKILVAQLLPDWPFEVVRGALPGVPRKPDPAAAVAIADEIGVAPSEFLYVGDTNTDMQTAVAAGMFPVGVLWGYRTAEELTENGAKVLVKEPTEILALL